MPSHVRADGRRTAGMCLSFPICPPGGHPGCSHVSAVVISTAVNTGRRRLFEILASVLLDKRPEVGLPGHAGALLAIT